ncbi:alpha/beta fold hydrolase [Geomonas sp. RF6]|uniref:alpha/beta fold hydrolase n=1 Tax=Geomonas sp. RF6 TaxID=2897342 RepID=UPI001E33A31A|nr:alpha/beta fold hydrolase [Geomonas sp. RF6]UFS69390.1 alpha/beta fold hydrolase [Geomonas sp. RF6]
MPDAITEENQEKSQMRLNYETYGEGHPLVILHGLFGSLENWRTIGKELGRHYRVFALDLRNHGKSPHADDFDYATMAEDLHAFVEEQSLSRIFLLGHSMGGKVAMQFSVTWPELVEKLVVVDMSPKEYNPQHREILEAMLSLHPERFTERKEVDHALSSAIKDSATRLFLLKNLVADERGRFAWRLNLKAIARNYGDLVKGIPAGRAFDGPTLFMKGENSNYIRQEDVSRIKHLFPAAYVVSVPDAGHWVHAENPTFFLSSVIAFLHS